MIGEPWLEQYVPDGGKLALDIGANVGDWTGFLATRFDSVWAFEPNPDLRDEFAAFNDRVTFHDCALGAESGTLRLYRYAESANTSAVIIEELHANIAIRGDSTGVLDVEMSTVDSFHADPDFIKVDVEGYECEVLAGAAQTLERCSPVVLVEVHSLENGLKASWLFGALGYHVKAVEHPGYPAGLNNYWLVAYREQP